MRHADEVIGIVQESVLCGWRRFLGEYGVLGQVELLYLPPISLTSYLRAHDSMLPVAR